MKKVLSVLLVATSLFALVGCGGKTENLQKEVDALKQSLAELQATVSTQSEQIGTLQGEKTAQAEKIAELEAAKAAQAETIAALQNSANLSAEEKWNFDEIKCQCAIQNGYEVLTIWESEYKENKEATLQKCIAFLISDCYEKNS